MLVETCGLEDQSMAAVHHTQQQKRQLAEIRAMRPQPCALADRYPDTCPVLIDYALTYPNPWSVTVEHLILASNGGGDGPIAPAHLHYQKRQGGEVRAGKVQTFEQYTSGVW